VLFIVMRLFLAPTTLKPLFHGIIPKLTDNLMMAEIQETKFDIMVSSNQIIAALTPLKRCENAPVPLLNKIVKTATIAAKISYYHYSMR